MDNNDWSHVESHFEGLDHQLEEAKKHAFKVRVDFETRVRVWKDQVLPDRLLALDRTLLLADAIRFHDLTVRDVQRLQRRAKKEFLQVADNPTIYQYTLTFFQHLYSEREKLLVHLYRGFYEQMIDKEYHND